MRVMELHAPLRVVQRSKGRSATAAAAYRAAERIRDERTGQVHDFTHKRGLEGTAMLLPDAAPDWAHDRAQLWNAAELREKHPKAQTARDVEIAFPTEFNARQRREAGLAIAAFLVERHGVAVDVAWHKPGRKSDERNHHVHMLFTTRQFENGEWSKTKPRTFDDLYGKGSEEVTALRRGVADVMNDIAARDRLNVYVEHQSFEKRGIDREATQHMGPVATEMERKGRRTDIGDKNRAIKQRNAQREQLRTQEKSTKAELAHEAQSGARQQTLPALPDYDAAMTSFYRTAQDKRREMLERLAREYGQDEQNAQAEIARRTKAIDKAGFFSRWFRNVTGRTEADRTAIARHEQMLDTISAQRRQAADAFEARRLQELTRVQERYRQEETHYDQSIRQLQQEQYNRLPEQKTEQAQQHTTNHDFARASDPAPPEPVSERDRIREYLRQQQKSQNQNRGRSM